MAMTDISIRHAAATHRQARVSPATLIALWRSRRALARLDDAALKDVGIDRAAAHAEAARPLWDVPGAWRR